MAEKRLGIAGKILHNTLWYGIETLVEAVVFVGTSIAVAHYLGPEKLGYFSYINFFVVVITRTAGTGLASATRKYMSEFLAANQPGQVKAVYFLAYKYQLLGSLIIAALGMVSIALYGEGPYRTMSYILLLSIVPGVMSWIPAQANSAFEDLSPNTFSAFGYIVVYSLIIASTIHFNWQLIGVASAGLIGRSAEVVLRTIPLHAKLRALPDEQLESSVVRRVRRFCAQSIGVQLLTSVVYDRSEMFLLRAFSSLEQIAYYSLSFGFVTNLGMFPRIFSTATGVSLMAKASRDGEPIDQLIRTSSRYLLLVVLPINLGAVAITSSAIQLAYGTRYIGAVPVLMTAASLAIPGPFGEIPTTLLRSTDRQDVLLIWMGLTGAVNVVLDLLLIPRHGAVGAAWGNGIAQGLGVVAFWLQAKRFYSFTFPLQTAARLLGASLAMASVAYGISHSIHGVLGLVLAVSSGLPVYVVMLRIFGGLDGSDAERLAPLGNRLPKNIASLYRAMVVFASAHTS